MKKKKVFITGISGYLAGALCRELAGRDWCAGIWGADVRPPPAGPAVFRKIDINSPELVEWAASIEPDIFIHLAFIVNPIRDEELMRRVNVEGTANALTAAAAGKSRQLLVASSGTAYGAWPDNPVPLKESDPIRPHPTFQYANDKAQVEFLCRDFIAEHPEIVVAIVRPCVVYGPNVDNYLSNLLTGLPWVTGLRGYDPPLQFVHEEDVAGAILAILEREASGPFNIAPPDSISLGEAIRTPGKPAIFLPDRLAEAVVALAWRLGLPLLKAPASLLDFLRYPWVLDSSRLREKVGYSFKYSTRQTLEIMLRAKGLKSGSTKVAKEH